jgi:hypothetical protein
MVLVPVSVAGFDAWLKGCGRAGQEFERSLRRQRGDGGVQVTTDQRRNAFPFRPSLQTRRLIVTIVRTGIGPSAQSPMPFDPA